MKKYHQKKINQTLVAKFLNLFLTYSPINSFKIEFDGTLNMNIHVSKRNPFATFTNPKDESKIVVATYAWDGNAFPGNEYYRGMLIASGDPAAACCSTMAELGNSYINPDGLKNIITYPYNEI